MRFIRLLLLCLFTVSLFACHSAKEVSGSSHQRTPSHHSGTSNKKADVIIKTARSYNGTPYKAGGVDRNGMDCSGLAYVSFGKYGLQLPRRSIEQSKMGQAIELKHATEGDLLFFDTKNDKPKEVNHVGIVIDARDKNNIIFIHATTQRGVMENKLSEKYYKDAFIKAKRVL